MIVPMTKILTRQDEDGIWIAKSQLLPGCHAHGSDRGEAILRFQQAAKVHLEALLETPRHLNGEAFLKPLQFQFSQQLLDCHSMMIGHSF